VWHRVVLQAYNDVLEEYAVSIFRFEVFSGGYEENHEDSQDRRYRVRDMNSGLDEYEARVLPI
jgi:hypothetical protein